MVAKKSSEMKCGLLLQQMIIENDCRIITMTK